MDDKERLEKDIGDLKHSYEKMQEVLNDLREVEGLDEQYNLLHTVAEDINDKRIKNENELERLEDI
ncbi:MAG: hypothetical protein HFJ20_04430 [Clostridia bacterium]|nr:hypothetical protein [Clostridia bacterium]